MSYPTSKIVFWGVKLTPQQSAQVYPLLQEVVCRVLGISPNDKDIRQTVLEDYQKSSIGFWTDGVDERSPAILYDKNYDQHGVGVLIESQEFGSNNETIVRGKYTDFQGTFKKYVQPVLDACGIQKVPDCHTLTQIL